MATLCAPDLRAQAEAVRAETSGAAALRQPSRQKIQDMLETSWGRNHRHRNLPADAPKATTIRSHAAAVPSLHEGLEISCGSVPFDQCAIITRTWNANGIPRRFVVHDDHAAIDGPRLSKKITSPVVSCRNIIIAGQLVKLALPRAQTAFDACCGFDAAASAVLWVAVRSITKCLLNQRTTER